MFSRETLDLFPINPKLSQQRHLLGTPGQHVPSISCIPLPSWKDHASSGHTGAACFFWGPGVLKFHWAEGEELPPFTAQQGPRDTPHPLQLWSLPSPTIREQRGPEAQPPTSHLGLDNLLWKVAHGICQPAFQALGKIPDGLCQGTWETQAMALSVRKAASPLRISLSLRDACAVAMTTHQEQATQRRDGENLGLLIREGQSKNEGHPALVVSVHLSSALAALSQGSPAPREYQAMFGDTCGCLTGGTPGMEGVGTRDAVTSPPPRQQQCQGHPSSRNRPTQGPQC